MIATPVQQMSIQGSRPAFRVLCAWCEQPIHQATPATGAALTRTSHGICKPCAMQHFGLDLDLPLEGQICA